MKELLLKIFIVAMVYHAFENRVCAQPYIDLINIRNVKSPDVGFFRHNKNETELSYVNISSTLPLLFNNKKDGIIISPFYEQWSSAISGIDSFRKTHFGIALPLSLLETINSKWSLLVTSIVRINDTSLSRGSKWQFGGAILAAHKNANGKFTYKFGAYINGDLFGLFVMPLLGIDWNISPATNLFGILPGNLTLEHRLTKILFCGATFRAITNSYTDFNNHYWRIDENQLGLFADCYLTKNIVLNMEAGHSFFRKIRTGMRKGTRTDWMANDNMYLKLALAYRLRLK
ncbi:MAG TPA: DUF6268 family outer membrane beta-barrel protein [Puia sp.]|nr:DUF6268 family outer membrane beta-barrel protein [Puia sp.]